MKTPVGFGLQGFFNISDFGHSGTKKAGSARFCRIKVKPV